MTRATLFQSNRSRAVWLPRDVACPEEVRAVEILRFMLEFRRVDGLKRQDWLEVR